jgi:hypothetical protein
MTKCRSRRNRLKRSGRSRSWLKRSGRNRRSRLKRSGRSRSRSRSWLKRSRRSHMSKKIQLFKPKDFKFVESEHLKNIQKLDSALDRIDPCPTQNNVCKLVLVPGPLHDGEGEMIKVSFYDEIYKESMKKVKKLRDQLRSSANKHANNINKLREIETEYKRLLNTVLGLHMNLAHKAFDTDIIRNHFKDLGVRKNRAKRESKEFIPDAYDNQYTTLEKQYNQWNELLIDVIQPTDKFITDLEKISTTKLNTFVNECIEFAKELDKKMSAYLYSGSDIVQGRKCKGWECL